MIKIIFSAVILVLLSACTSTMEQKPSKHMVKHSKKMFQTVDAKDAQLVQKGEHKNSCVICGMNLVKFYKTSHIANDNGVEKQYCSIHCLANDLDQGKELKNPMVVDTKTLKFIPVLEAYYVVGSDVRGTMSHESKYAFGSLDDAKKFQAKHGGKIMDFRAALDEARKDFKH